MSSVEIYTDGACRGNPGPGGWGATLEMGEHFRELSGAEAMTTNNRMELQAVIEALRALKRPCPVDFFLDSEYVRKGITAWMSGWKARGWRPASKQAVKNEDLWRVLDDALANSEHSITWHWVKGHSGNPGNDRADALANEGVRLFQAG